MNNANTLTSRQLMIMIILFSVGTTILVVPTLLVVEAKQDAWISGLAGISVGMILLWLYVKVGKRFEGANLFQINEIVLGKWLGMGINLLFASLSTVLGAQVLFYIGIFMTTQIMPTTPIQAIHILMITIVVIGVKLGITNLARTAEIFFPWIVLFFFLLLIFIMPQVHVQNMLPVGEASMKSIIRATSFIVSYSYIPLFLVYSLISPDTRFPINFAKSFYFGGLTSGMILLAIAVLSVLVLGVDQSARQSYSTYALAKKINVGNFLQRIEVTVAILWYISIFFKLTLYFHTGLSGIAYMFRIQNYKVLAIPLGLIVIVFSLMVYPNKAYIQLWDQMTWIPLVIVFGIIHPIVILGISRLRGK
ncbi:endospore germination permease [Paenibacillus sp. SYP-B3998]|uniref:Endospore germination permease n=1 Tax=Paenibacillus sp. SYP-B3998 TaxID=2678564 RepID=A0A6G3ZWN9_9BACL|nr:endospore germination permease [Paenibacillus sp. SYP-B3998]NEW06636.1 endospore germination permease [Paenibacillus sp. SYP-B3998]